MKKATKVLSRCIWLLIFLALCQLIAHGALFVLNIIYSALHKWFGEAFPLYTPISNGEEYQVWYTVMSLIAYLISLFISVYLSILLSNRANEHLISKTDGLFTLREGLPLYLKEFSLSDAIASTVSSVALLLPITFIPEGFFTKDYSFFFTFQKLIYDTVGLPIGIILSAVVTFALHFPMVLPAMKRWRANWLTGFAR